MAIPLPSFEFCVPPNPLIGDLRLHAELSLQKLRTGRTSLEFSVTSRSMRRRPTPSRECRQRPTARSSFPPRERSRPTQYRYSVLIARAKELAQQAAQVEAAFLGASVQRDQAAYTLHKARQELTLARRRRCACKRCASPTPNAVKLSQLQQQRTVIQLNAYQDWLNRSLNEHEQLMLQKYAETASQQQQAIKYTALLQVAQATIAAAGAGFGAAAAAAGVTVAYAAASAATSRAGSLRISNATLRYRRCRRLMSAGWMSGHCKVHWRRRILFIAQQEIVLAQDRQEIAEQEKSIADTQASQARDTAEFLGNQFLNVELFDWMTGVLSGVYRSLLRAGDRHGEGRSGAACFRATADATGGHPAGLLDRTELLGLVALRAT